MQRRSVQNHLRLIREQRGLSQRELARIAGVYHPAICQIESGKRSPTLRTMKKLAAALQVDISKLFI